MYSSTGTLQAVQDLTRPTANYYTTKYTVYDRNGNRVNTNLGDNGGSFTFRNRTETGDASVPNPVDETVVVMLTEYIENTVNVGAIEITKNTASPDGVSNGEAHNDKLFEFTIALTDVFGITCSDEMNPAYLQLYEHINEKRDVWGAPTFVFKITQTGYYDYTDPLNPSITSCSGGTMVVALTVDDAGTRSAGLETHTSPAYDYTSWLEESTVENEYQGMYNIGDAGKIRLEPGQYQITRVPVARYEFVENTWKLAGESDNEYTGSNRTSTEVMTVTIPAMETAIVHYYDNVAYYDKFAYGDETVNKLYKLNQTGKANETIKGIRVKDITNVDTDANVTIDQNSSELKLYFIYVDGSEREADASEKAKLRFAYEDGDTDFQSKTGLSTTSTSESSFTITAYSDFKDNIYTLKAVYDNKFSTNFDLVFERSS